MNKKKQEWHAISVTAPKEGSDWISHLLFELGSVGNLEEESPNPALIAMKGYFPVELGPSNAIIQSIIELLRQQGIEPLSTYATTIKIQNWAEQARQMFSPIKILQGLTIISPWSDYKPAKAERVVVINPGMAFGTGYHATTQLAANLLVKALEIWGQASKGGMAPTVIPAQAGIQSRRTLDSRLRGNDSEGGNDKPSLCDVGSGSGILSIIAETKGAEHIVGVEIDPDAVTAAEENLVRNKCRYIKFTDDIEKVKEKFDIVVANILLSTIVELKDTLLKLCKDEAFLILSGIMMEEHSRLRAAFDMPDLKLIEEEERDGWMGYLYSICRNS